jgi:hypothetical protein
MLREHPLQPTWSFDEQNPLKIPRVPRWRGIRCVLNRQQREPMRRGSKLRAVHRNDGIALRLRAEALMDDR